MSALLYNLFITPSLPDKPYAALYEYSTSTVPAGTGTLAGLQRLYEYAYEYLPAPAGCLWASYEYPALTPPPHQVIISARPLCSLGARPPGSPLPPTCRGCNICHVSSLMRLCSTVGVNPSDRMAGVCSLDLAVVSHTLFLVFSPLIKTYYRPPSTPFLYPY